MSQRNFDEFEEECKDSVARLEDCMWMVNYSRMSSVERTEFEGLYLVARSSCGRINNPEEVDELSLARANAQINDLETFLAHYDCSLIETKMTALDFQIERVPGYNVLRQLRPFLSKQYFENSIEAHIAEIQEEFIEHLSNGESYTKMKFISKVRIAFVLIHSIWPAIKYLVGLESSEEESKRLH